MQTRHRIPTIFNLSMVDVLCCALGCVILLWLLNFREAKRRAAAAGESAKQLKVTQGSLAAAQKDLDALRSKHAGILASLTHARAGLDAETRKHADTLATLTLTRSQVVGLEETVRALEARGAEAAAGLKARTGENADLARKLVAAGRTLAGLEKEITAKKTQLVTLNSKVEDLTGRLLASEELIKKLRQTEGDLTQQSKDYRDRLAAVDARVLTLSKEAEKGRTALSAADQRILALLTDKTGLEKKLTASSKEADRRCVELLAERSLLKQQLAASARELSGARLNLTELEAGNKALRQQVQQARAAVVDRFAGLELTGKKVVFLIDISGSMKMRDENTLSPTKWPTVCDTLGKLMRSLPNLTHYQVILFSNSVRYLQGSEGQWLAFDPQTSADSTVAALRKIDPRHGTKMSPAFAEAFRFRAQGLDTIYLFSDGLPNDDDALPADVANLAEGPRTIYLSNRVRQLLRTVWNRPEAGRPAVRINSVGFFFDSPEVGAFLWALSREHEGGFVGMSRP